MIKIGFNVQKLADESFIATKFTPGFQIGGAAFFEVNSKFSFQPELIFNFNSIDFDGDIILKIDNDEDGSIDEDPFDFLDNDNDGSIDEDDIDYFCKGNGSIDLIMLEIPLLVKYKLGSSAKKKKSLYIGSSVDFLLNANLYRENESSHDDTNVTRKNIGLNGILGFDYRINKFSFDLRFSGSIVKDSWKFKSKYDYIYIGGIEEVNYELPMKERKYSLSLSIGISL